MTPEIVLIDNFIDAPETLFQQVMRDTVWNTQLASRKTASFGVNYQYNGVVYDKLAMPSYLQALAMTIDAQLGFLPNNCLINYYQDGQSKMGFHMDDVSQMVEGTGVAIISLGQARKITYRCIKDKSVRVDYLLSSGSLLYMDDKVQTLWQHAILKDETIDPRLSLTFRQLTV